MSTIDVEQLTLIRRTDFFADLPQSQVDRLLTSAQVTIFPPDTRLFQEDGYPQFIYFVLSGIVDLYKSKGKRSYGVLMLSSGDLFMPAAALFNEKYLTSARTLTTAEILSLQISTVRQEAAYSVAFAMQLAQVMGGQWRMAVRHILDLKCRSAPERLAAFLLRLVDDAPFGDGSVLPIPKRDLARRVGMTPETLSRSLQRLAQNGLHLRGNEIIVRDRTMIDAFCGPALYVEAKEPALHVNAL